MKSSMKSFDEWWDKFCAKNNGWGIEPDKDDVKDAWEAATALEREACALVCDAVANAVDRHSHVAYRCEDAIRARGSHEES